MDGIGRMANLALPKLVVCERVEEVALDEEVFERAGLR